MTINARVTEKTKEDLIWGRKKKLFQIRDISMKWLEMQDWNSRKRIDKYHEGRKLREEWQSQTHGQHPPPLETFNLGTYCHFRADDSLFFLFVCFLFLRVFFEVQLIYHVVPTSAVQQSDSVYIYIHFFMFFSIMVYPRRLDIVPCAIQQDLIVYPF